MEKIRPILNVLRNKYLIVGTLALVWMLFLDQYDLISHIRLNKRINKLEEEKAFYLQEKERLEEEKLLMTNPDAVERYARENLWMKRPDEDLFIVMETPSGEEK